MLIFLFKISKLRTFQNFFLPILLVVDYILNKHGGHSMNKFFSALSIFFLTTLFSAEAGISNSIYLSKATLTPRACKQALDLVLSVLQSIATDSKPSNTTQYAPCLKAFYDFVEAPTKGSQARERIHEALNKLDKKAPNTKNIILNLAYHYGVERVKSAWGHLPVLDDRTSGIDPSFSNVNYCTTVRADRQFIKGLFASEGYLKKDEELRLAAKNWLQNGIKSRSSDFVSDLEKGHPSVKMIKNKNSNKVTCKAK